MQGSIRKLALIVSLSLLNISLPTALRAQQTEDNDDPKFVQTNVSPADLIESWSQFRFRINRCMKCE